MTARADVLLVATEASGDLLAREVAEALKQLKPDIHLAAIGGPELASLGLSSQIDLSPVAILGYVEALKVYPKVIALADAAADEIVRARPDIVVLVDAWGFMIRLARRLRARAPGIRLVKLIGPQVWATRPGRARTLARTVDHLLCMYDIETPFYADYGLKTTVVGNPALSRSPAGDGEQYRRDRNIPPDCPLVLVLPGSRQGEVARVAPALVEAARQISDRRPDTVIVFAPAPTIRTAFEARFPDLAKWARIEAESERRFDAMAAASLALACSGTVTTEVAIQGAPMIVAYKTGWLTWAAARGFLYRKRHISLINILNNDEEIVPEFVQTRQSGVAIADKALAWLSDPQRLANQRQAQAHAVKALWSAGGTTPVRAAKAILEDLRSQRALIGT